MTVTVSAVALRRTASDLIITIRIDDLPAIVSDPRNPEFDVRANVVSESEFVEGMLRQLCREEEDGTTLVHLMLDRALSLLREGDGGVTGLEERA